MSDKREGIRFLKVRHIWEDFSGGDGVGDDYCFIFYEDGVYERPWKSSSDGCRWKLDDKGTLTFIDVTRTSYRDFFGVPDETREISKTVKHWVEELEFYDSVDDILD
jgi:hypothetical protein